MIYDRFASALNTIPLLSPQDTIATALATPFVNLSGAHGGTLFVHFGTITSVSADEAITVTLEAATTGASGAEAAVAFDYRLSDAVGSNVWNDITAATSSGATIATTDDNKLLAIDINPSKFLAACGSSDATYFRAVITPNAAATVTLVSAIVQLEPRYSQSTMVSAT